MIINLRKIYNYSAINDKLLEISNIYYSFAPLILLLDPYTLNLFVIFISCKWC